MRNNKAQVVNVAVLITSLVVSVVVLEVYLRMFNPLNFRLRGNKILLATRSSKIKRNQPSEKLDEYILFKKNSLGFRGDEPPTNFADVLSVVTVGGSTTECVVLGEGQTWTDHLGEMLRSRIDGFWINNAGLDGHSTNGHLVLMRDYISALKPKIVLFLVGINDERVDVAEHYDSEGIVKMSNTSVAQKLMAVAEKSEIVAYMTNLNRWGVAEKLGLSTDQVVNFNELDSGELKLLAEVGDVEREMEYKVLGIATNSAEFLQEKLESYEPGLEAYKSRLIKLIELSRENNIDPILITQPAVYGGGVDSETGVDLGSIPVGSDGDDWQNGYTGHTKWTILESYNQVVREV
ncbi:SGNH/GDSL hydrolase family protein, partial [Pseudomonadota bacterium]